ncbi:MAG: transcriptional regulator [Alphaproteobacteria bacterium]
MIISDQIVSARALLRWNVNILADKSGVSAVTIRRMETRGTGVSNAANVQAVQNALENAGIDFINQNQDSIGDNKGVGVRFKHAQHHNKTMQG